MIRKQAKSGYYRKLIQSARWRSLRLDYLMAHPLCEDCSARGLVVATEEIHHVQPVETARGDLQQMARLCFDVGNLRALCRACHREAHRRLESRSKKVVQARNSQETERFLARYLPSEEA